MKDPNCAVIRCGLPDCGENEPVWVENTCCSVCPEEGKLWFTLLNVFTDNMAI